MEESGGGDGEDLENLGESAGVTNTAMTYAESQLGSLDRSTHMQASPPASIFPSVYYVNEPFSYTLDLFSRRPHSCPVFTLKSNTRSTTGAAFPSVITLSEFPPTPTSSESISSLQDEALPDDQSELSIDLPSPPFSPTDQEEGHLPPARNDQNEISMNAPEIPADLSRVVHQPDDGSSPNETPQYVQALLRFLYMTGQSCYQRNPKRKEEMTSLEWIMSAAQKVYFWLLTFLGVCYCMFAVKRNILIFVAFRDMDDLLSAIFYACCLFVVTYFVHLVTCCQNDVTNMLNTKWEAYDSFTNKGGQDNQLKYAYRVAMGFGVLSQIMSVLKTILSVGFQKWTVESMLLQYSKLFANGLLYQWNPSVYTNATGDVLIKYGTNLALTTFLFGSTGMIMHISFILRIDAVRDILVFVAFANKLHVFDLVKRVGLLMEHKTDHSVDETIEEDVHCWTMYRMLLDVIDITNEVFDSLLNLMHLNNLLLLAVLLVDILDDGIGWLSMVVDIVDLGKAIVLYHIAWNSATKGIKCQRWIEALPCERNRFLVANSICSKSAILAEFMQRPLGLGSHLIDTSFLWNFLGLVLSIFGVLVGLRLAPSGTTD